MTLARHRLIFFTAASLLGLLAWDASGLDLPLAQLFGDAHGFALTRHWVLAGGLHDGGRLFAWAVLAALVLAVWRPPGPLRTLTRRTRTQLVLSALAAVLFVSLLKGASPTSCPWDLSAFGGPAHHVSHWLWRPDGGGGHCFPAGHASSGFAFLGGYFALRREAPGLARRWLVAALAAGFTFGLAQQVRGAHFMSHTLWSAWLCWAVGQGLDAAWQRLAQRGAARSTQSATARA